jgi:hypothetical protein
MRSDGLLYQIEFSRAYEKLKQKGFRQIKNLPEPYMGVFREIPFHYIPKKVRA